MSRRRDEEDDWDDDEPWDEDAWAEGDEETTIACPYCQCKIHDDAPVCPECGNYLSREDAPAARKPWWIVIGVALCLYAIYRWVVW
jgi:uncharacterized paraquat-inducible protein A